MADAVLLVDPRGEVSRANQAAVRLTGRPLEELVGLHPADIFGPGVPTSPWELFRLAPGGTLESIDAYVHTMGDRARPVGVSCAAIQDSSGKVVGAVYAARDTSRRKEAEDQREAQLRLTRILATSRTIGDAFPQALEAIGESFGWQLAAAWLLDPPGTAMGCQEIWHSPTLAAEGVVTAATATPVQKGRGATGAVWESGRVEWSAEVARDPDSSWAGVAAACSRSTTPSATSLAPRPRTCSTRAFGR